MATMVRGAESVLTDAVRSFLTATPPRYAVIAVAGASGIPHQNVVWYLLRQDERGDVFILNSRRGRYWPTSLEREGMASLAIHDGEEAVAIRCELVDLYGGEPSRVDAEELARRYDPPERANLRIRRFRTVGPL